MKKIMNSLKTTRVNAKFVGFLFATFLKMESTKVAFWGGFLYNFSEKFYQNTIGPLIHNVPKWSNAL